MKVLNSKSKKLFIQPNIDIKTISLDENCGIHSSGQRLSNENYLDFGDVVTSNTVWQPDVYNIAKEISDNTNIKRIIDLGCGNARKLFESFSDKDFELILIDMFDPREFDREYYQDKNFKFIESKFNSYLHTESLYESLRSEIPTLIICSDVIEHLMDPLPMMKLIRKILRDNVKNISVLSTPDADKTYSQAHHVPQNKAHIREWSARELSDFVGSCGFEIVSQYNVRSNNFDMQFRTSLLILSCQNYDSFLEKNNLPPADTSLFIVTSELARAAKTGGIGSYVDDLSSILNKATVLLVEQSQDVSESNIKKDWISSFDLLADSTIRSSQYGEGGGLDEIAFKSLEILYAFYDIKNVIIQEYLGIGYRIIQAKQAKLLLSFAITIVCHGSLMYLANSNESFNDFYSNYIIFYKEKYCIENADRIVFLTDFLKDLYKNYGYIFDESKIKKLRAPLVLKDIKNDEYIQKKIENLVFIGKLSKMKGCDELMKALQVLHEEGYLGREIKKLYIVGPLMEFPDNLSREIFEEIKEVEGFKIERLFLKRADLMQFISKLRMCSIFIYPYRADNHPLTIIEAIKSKLNFIAYAAGGIPELVSNENHDKFLCQPKSYVLSRKIISTLFESPDDSYDKITNEHNAWLIQQDKINQENKLFFEDSNTNYSQNNILPQEDLVTIIVPTYNTKLEYIKDACLSINRQTYKPSEVIFINDGSDGNYEKIINEAVQLTLKVPYRIITQMNLGLASARNTGLKNAQTKYVVTLDDDDILLNDGIEKMVLALENNTDHIAITSELISFQEDEEWDSLHNIKERYIYRPTCHGLSAMTFLQNTFGSAHLCINREILLSLGGWDDSSRARWEDYALYIRLLSLGYKVLILPKVTYGYRVRKSSMVRTYAEYPGIVRIANNYLKLDRFDSVYTSLLMNDLKNRLYVNSAESISELDFYKREYDSSASRLARKFRGTIKKNKFIYSFLNRMYKRSLQAWKTLRK